MKMLKVYTDFAEDLEPLSEAEIGRLFKAMLQYASTETVPDLKGNERFLWSTVKKNIDRQKESYDNMCTTNKRIATERNEALRSVTKRNGALQDKDKDKDKEKDKDINTLFESFWSAYPKKKAKENARKAFAKALKLTTLEDLLAAIEANKQTKQWQKDNGQYIPYPASWLNEHGWEDEISSKALSPTGRRAVTLTEFGDSL